MHCLLARGQWAVGRLQCTASLPGSSGRCRRGVVWCGVPKAMLEEGNGRDLHPRVQVYGGAVCVARATCVRVWLQAYKWGAGETWMSPSWRQLSLEKFPRYSLSLRLLMQA